MNAVVHPDDLPLAGLTVLDLSQGIAGPSCCAILRQQGARVIKIEPPEGDWARHMGRSTDGHTAISIAYNAGKESVVVDGRTAEGRATLRALALSADVVVQNYRPGVAERLGVGYAALAEAHPRVIYVSISGFGSEGPQAGLPALDTTVQALTGLMHLNRDAQGQPRRIGFFVVDICTGLYAAQAVAARLYQTARTGRGRHIEVSMLQTAAALQAYEIVDGALFPGAGPGAFNAPTGLFATADGQIYVSMLNDAMFRRLGGVLSLSTWETDPALQTSAGRLPRAAALNQQLAAALAERPTAHWEAVFTAHDILHGRVRTAIELREDAQAQHVGLFGELSQAGLATLPWPGLPGGGGHQPPPGAAPRLGEHTTCVLHEFRLTPQQPG
ncbi:CoA transferase [Achromobacter sp. GG226]|uniref:CaiB/BaiF CoA transferase family protein n=1 Tax=Verticiella alkaliphila TaxID=2779529 RepID=UPI001C0AEB4F|nr:CoA transferase [Verticiella sp. GG226]MBU4612323.1 CoA transferase [Verticiella sp. GG226]